MAYKKILQLRRSTNIWLTKNMAKAEVEIHAKNLHPEYGSAYADAKDGEPIIARYWDVVPSGVTFSYSSIGSTSPYSESTGATHVWVSGFDDLTSVPAIVDKDSPAYIKVTANSTTTYYKLVTNPESPTGSGTVSSIFGVAYHNTEGFFIEWFDSAEDAEAILKSLNVNDANIVNGFVAAVKQKDGKIEPIHGTLSSEKAISLTEAAYAYVRIGDGTVAPSDWELTNDNHSANVPSDPTIASPKYYRKDIAGDPVTYEYYELKKDIRVALEIDDPSNILAQGAVKSWTLLNEAPSVEWDSSNTFTAIPSITSNSPEYIRVGNVTAGYRYYQLNETASTSGLSANLTLRALSPDEISDSNIREAYKLVGNADGTETVLGDIIKIYKDQNLVKVYLGHVDDTIDPTTGVITDGSGNDALCFVYKVADGSYSLVAVDVESFLMENEFKDGLEVKQGSYRYAPCDEPETFTPSAANSFASIEELNATYPNPDSSSPEYVRYGTEPNWNYMKLNHQGEVYVRLTNAKGLDFYNESSGNKSVGIKIDATNVYFRLAEGSEETPTHKRYTMYEWKNGANMIYTTSPKQLSGAATYSPTGDLSNEYAATENTVASSPTPGNFFEGGSITVGATTYTASGNVYDGYVEDATGTYLSSPYLYTNTNGLGIYDNAIETKIESAMLGKMKVNGVPFVKKSDGSIGADPTGNNIKVAVSADTIPVINEVVTEPTGVMAKGIYAYNGTIYYSDGTHAVEQYDPSTMVLTEAEATMISLYLAYNLDMGTYTIS